MQLIDLKVNEILLLRDIFFNNSSNSIEFLNDLAKRTKNLEEKFLLLKEATQKIEKFHSFFHFEQSYFHLQLAISYLKEDNNDKAVEQLELALFQDHLNQQAKSLLEGTKCPEKQLYQRQYSNFTDYVSFATEEKKISRIEPEKNSYWKITNLEKIIEAIRHQHLNYHIESAKLYLNRAMVFYELGEIDLAKNDLVKASYLDSSLKTRSYYLPIAKKLKI